MVVTVNVHEANKHLSRLVDQAAKGSEFVIAKAGKPIVRVLPIGPLPATRTLGSLAGKGIIAADVKEASAADVEAMFAAGS